MGTAVWQGVGVLAVGAGIGVGLMTGFITTGAEGSEPVPSVGTPAPVATPDPYANPVPVCDEDTPHYSDCVVRDDSDAEPGVIGWYYVWEDGSRMNLHSLWPYRVPCDDEYGMPGECINLYDKIPAGVK